MAKNVRERMIAGALELLGRKGLQATSFAEVTQATSTPRGSIYHHFPGGKQEMVRAALEMDCTYFRQRMATLTHASPSAFITAAADWWRQFIAERDFEGGCPVAAVTVAADTQEQLDQAAAIFGDFVTVIDEGLRASGASSEEETHAFATLVIASLEGANILARSARNFTAFDTISTQLVDQAERLTVA